MRRSGYPGRVLAAATLTLFVASCGGSSNGISPSSGLPTENTARGSEAFGSFRPQASGKIKHVVIIVQENRSFDNLFHAFPGADTKGYGYTSTGEKVTLQPVGLESTWDIDHSSGAFFAACNGQGSIPGTNCQMNGFDQEYVGCGHRYYPPCPNAHPQYSFVPATETKPYFQLGKQYVLADRMFASNFDASSFISHQYIIAGQADSAVDYPNGPWGCDGSPSERIGTVTTNPPRQYGGQIRPCFDYQTLGDELDTAGLSWGFYTATLEGDGNIWSAYQAVKHIYQGADWSKDIITPQTQFLKDVTSNLRTVSWITPTCENSDHAGCGDNTGPAWVASLVNAIGKSQYWKSTAIFIMWDDYGGWYDHVPPPYVDYDGLGMRIPLLIVSPYAKQHYVSSVQYEHGSILRFIEDQFGLPRLTASDARATSPAADCFDFSQPPRRFKTIQADHDQNFFLRQPPDHRPPDTQ
ncbi:MAG: alkaline phosphatase family protein [Candidatus Tumulicola sp.]